MKALIWILGICWMFPLQLQAQHCGSAERRLKRPASSKLQRTRSHTQMRLKSGERQAFEVLQPNAQATTTEHFRIIWGNTEHPNTPQWSDLNKNQIPDYIDFISTQVEFVWNRFINEGKFRAPQGSDRYYVDIYLGNTGLYDPVFPSDDLVFDASYFGFQDSYWEPNSGEELASDVSFLALNSELASDVLQATFAHEFFHVLQDSYRNSNTLDDEDTELWWYEASAVWTESWVYQDGTDYDSFVKRWLQEPEKSLFTFNASHEYGSAIWAKYLSENFAAIPEEPIRKIWENLENQSLHQSFQKFFSSQTVQPAIKTFQEAFIDFSRSLLLLSDYYEAAPRWNTSVSTADISKVPTQESVSYNSSFAPGIYGVRISKIQRPSNLTSPLSIQFDGGDYVQQGTQGLAIQWHLLLYLEDTAGKLSEYQHFVLGAYQYQDIILSNQLDWKSAYLIQIPTVADPTKTLVMNIKGPDNKNYSVPQTIPLKMAIDYQSGTGVRLIATWQQIDNKIFSEKSFSEKGGTRLALQKGWNLVGDPDIASSVQMEQQLAPVAPFLNHVWQWSGENWRVYSPQMSLETLNGLYQSSFLPLNTLSKPSGLWIHMSEPADLYFLSAGVSPITTLSETGWHLLTSMGSLIVRNSFVLPSGTKGEIWLWRDDSWQKSLLILPFLPSLWPKEQVFGCGFIRGHSLFSFSRVDALSSPAAIRIFLGYFFRKAYQ